jgi:hypothetical protein
MAQTPDNSMSSFLHVQGLWKLPVATTRQTTSKSENERPAVPQLTVGKSDKCVLDFPPVMFWNVFSQHCDFTNSGSTSVIAIVGDLIRGRIEGKSLPLYKTSNCLS